MINLFDTKVSKSSQLSKKSKSFKNANSSNSSNTSNSSNSASNSSKNSKLSKPSKTSNYCQNYYVDISGNKNNKVYKMCNKYSHCRKNRCKNIDARIEAKKEREFGKDYDNYIKSKIEKKCPLTLKTKQRKQCETRTLKKIYSNHNIINLYNKLLECNRTLCLKDKRNFYNTMFKKNTIKLTKSEKKRLNEIENPEPDMYLIKTGDS